VRADPEESSQHIGDVTAEHAAVRVELVDHDDLELLEQLEPLRVVRQDRRMEHVRVGHDDLPGGTDRRADRGRRVPVVGRRDDRQAGRAGELAELGDLVLPEGLRREQEQPSRRRVLGDRLEGRQGIAQRLAGRGRRDDDDVFAGVDGVDGLELMGIQPVDVAFRQPGDDAGIEPGRHVDIGGFARRDHLVMDDAPGERRLLEEALEDRRGIGGGIGAHRRVSGCK
jgi:hypothetical protein